MDIFSSLYSCIVIEAESWKSVGSYIHSIGRKIVKVPGDGLCFPRAIAECLRRDYNMEIDSNTVISSITFEISSHYDY